MVFNHPGFKFFYAVFFALSLSSCLDSGGDDGGGDGTAAAVTLPTLTQLPVISSVVGSTATVNLSGLNNQYYYNVYVSTADFTDTASAVQMATVDSSSSTATWYFPLAGLGIAEPLNQDHTLYVRLVTHDYSNNSSDLSEAVQVKLLAAPTDLTTVSADSGVVSVEWPVVAGTTYNIYYGTSQVAEYSLGTSTKVPGGPFTSGAETFTPSVCGQCYVAVTVVDGVSESLPVSLTNSLQLSTAQPVITLADQVGDSVTVDLTTSSGLAGIRYYVSTTLNPTPATATPIYDYDTTSGSATSYVHNISTFYDAVSGEPLTYYYFAQAYSTTSHTDSTGVTHDFVSTSSISAVHPYAVATDNFRLLAANGSAIGGRGDVQKVGSNLYWGSTDNTVATYPLGAVAPVITTTSNATAYLVDQADPTVHYTSSYTSVYEYVSGSNTATLSLSETVVDMVQTSTYLYVLTSARILAVPKANLTIGGVVELATGLTTTTDIDLNTTTNTLYAAANGGVISLPTAPIAGATLVTESTNPANYIAVDATGSNLYALALGLNQTIRQVVLPAGAETPVKYGVSNNLYSGGILEVYGDWVYFSAATGTYRVSLLDSTVEKISSVQAKDIFVDELALESYVIADNLIYRFPEGYYYLPESAPTETGVVTTTAADTSVSLDIEKPLGQQIDFYMINGVAVDAGTASTLSTAITGLTNGLLLDVSIAAHNLMGSSPITTVQETPVLGRPYVSLRGGLVTGEMYLTLGWNNPIDRASGLTLNVYRSTTATVDTTGITPPVATLTYLAGDPKAATGNMTANYTDSGLTNGSLYYYSAVLNDAAADSMASQVWGTIPFAPYALVTTQDPARPGNSMATFNGNLYWANDTLGTSDISVWDNVTLATLTDSFANPVGVDAVELVADAFSSALYVTKVGSGSTAISKIAIDIGTGFGTESVFADAGFGLDRLITDGNSLYAAGSGSVIAVDLGFGTISTLYSSSASIGKLVVSGNYVYWAEGVTIKRTVRAVGNPVETVVTELNNIADIEVDANTGNIFYSVQDNAYFVISQYNPTTLATTVVTSSAKLGGFALDANGDVYTLLRRLPASADYSEFARVTSADGTETILTSGGPTGVTDIYVDGANVYSTSKYNGMYQLQ